MAPTQRLSLASPTAAGIEVIGRDCAIATGPELPPGDSESLRRWRQIVADPDVVLDLPPAARAVVDPSGAAIATSGRIQAIYRDTEAVRAALSGRLEVTPRAYQVRGITWLLESLRRNGGGVLADEMGLGKTLQAIGTLLLRAEAGPAQLVLCPTSLVGNWVNECRRFAPELSPVAYRGGELPPLSSNTVLIAGYPTLRLHARRLQALEWTTVVFDEAQFLKNHRTQAARAARDLVAAGRIALTGTPVENHLDDLWAVLNLVVPQVFRHRAQFRRQFSKPIDGGSNAAALRLRSRIAPVLLARKKLEVESSLPAKIHIELECELTEEQECRYDSIVAGALEDGFGSGLSRHGKVLAALTALKQVCNYPNFDEVGEPGRSGKLDAATEILRANIANGAPTLIFTQYRRTGDLLVQHLHAELGLTVPFVHGGLSQVRRAELVDDFSRIEGPLILILSLRAAGTGLTLTRATEVIHFDRWWNPAVEAQATDRAHRIGQMHPVTVTTLTTRGTIEAHIARMHRRKGALTKFDDTSMVAELAALDDNALLETLRRDPTELGA